MKKLWLALWVCTALLPAVTAAQAVGEQARVRVLTGRAVTTVGLIGMPATAVLVPLAPQLSEMFFRQPLDLFLIARYLNNQPNFI